MLKFAANLTMMFQEVPFLDRFELAALHGFKAVEFLWPYFFKPAELAQIIKENQLTVALFNTAGGDDEGQWGWAAVPGQHAEAMFKDSIEQALEYAAALDCRTVHVMAGIVPYPAEQELCRQIFIQRLRWAADRFAKYGRSITIEALCPDIKPHYLFSSQYQAMALRTEIGRDNVFTQLDTFHAQKVDGNLTHLIRDFAGVYGHVQIASMPDRHEPDHGEIDYRWIFRLLEEVGYQGYIGCEYNPRGRTASGLAWFKDYEYAQHS